MKSVQRLRRLIELARGASKEKFIAAAPHATLVVLGGVSEGSANLVTRAVTSVEASEFLKKRGKFDPNTRVYPLVKEEGINNYSQMIIVGRSSNSDICLESASISKMHALFTWSESPQGKVFQLADGNSSNGTWIDDRKLAPHQPNEIKSGAVLGFGGSIHMSFFYPAELYDSVLPMAQRPGV